MKSKVIFISLIILVSTSFAFDKTEKMVSMRDGTQLVTDIYQPSLGDNKLPAILIRTPYKRSAALDDWLIFTLVDLLHYDLIIQNTRGRFESEGIDSLFFDDGWGANQSRSASGRC